MESEEVILKVIDFLKEIKEISQKNNDIKQKEKLIEELEFFLLCDCCDTKIQSTIQEKRKINCLIIKGKVPKATEKLIKFICFGKKEKKTKKAIKLKYK